MLTLGWARVGAVRQETTQPRTPLPLVFFSKTGVAKQIAADLWPLLSRAGPLPRQQGDAASAGGHGFQDHFNAWR